MMDGVGEQKITHLSVGVGGKPKPQRRGHNYGRRLGEDKVKCEAIWDKFRKVDPANMGKGSGNRALSGRIRVKNDSIDAYLEKNYIT